jgi:DNA invertase Pin-like site-specific DNA recombinase
MPRRRRSPVAAAPDGTVVGYVRVSTNRQAESGLGLDAQRAAIEAECTRRGWDLVAILEDAGASGKSRKRRPGLQAALDVIDEGKAATLMSAKLDRLARSTVDFGHLMAEAKRGGWNIVVLDLGIDLRTPAGSMVANVIAAIAQWESEMIGERTSTSYVERRKRNPDARFGPPVRLPDDLRHRIKSMHDNGTSLNAIARTLNEESVPTAKGGRQWYPTTVAHVVRSVALDAEANATRSRRDDATT